MQNTHRAFLATAAECIRTVLDETRERTRTVPPPVKPPPPIRERRRPPRDREPWIFHTAPVIEWDDARATRTVKTSDEARDAIMFACIEGGGVIEFEPGVYNEIKLKTGWPILPTWGWDGMQPRLVLRAKGDVTIKGIIWQQGGGEVWVDGMTLMTNIGGLCPIGSPGQIGQMRFRRCKLVRNPDLSPSAFQGNDQKWGGRFYGGVLHFENCEWLTSSVEHSFVYADNLAGLIVKNCKAGPGGRTYMQTGTRVQFPKPAVWLGICIDGLTGEGLNSGSGGGSGVTIYGYPGDVTLKNITVRSSSTGNLAQNRALSVWEPENFGGVWDQRNGFATYRLTIDNFHVDYPGMTRPAFEIESVEQLWLGDMSTTTPGGKWKLDAPDQYPSGEVGEVHFIPDTSRNGLILPADWAEPL